MTQRIEMLNRAASTAATPLTADRLDPPLTELPPENRPAWGARQGGSRPALPLPPQQPTQAAPTPPDDQLAQMRRWAKWLLSTYATRARSFPDGLFCDPTWSMLLDLMNAHLHGKQISVSSLCIAGRVPATTALRRIGDLETAGLVTRMKDPRDGRRVFIELTGEGYAAMANYLTHMQGAIYQMTEECRRQG